MMIFVVILLTSKVMLECHGYVHINSMKIYEPTTPKNDSLFGYSIAYQPGIQRLIITAPQENEIGQVYTTGINSSNVVQLTIGPELFVRSPEATHDFWFGATVKANSKFFITCAPRFAEIKNKSLRKSKKRLTSTAAMGVCIINEYVDTDKYTSKRLKYMSNSVREINAPKFGQRQDSMGWSMDITESNQVLIGSPAMMIDVKITFTTTQFLTSVGLLFCKIKKQKLRRISINIIMSYMKAVPRDGRVAFYDNPASNPSLIYKVAKDNSYRYNFGYSVTSGRFFDQSIVYTISTTFGNGKVYFFNSKQINIDLIEDPDVGSLFGAALCVAQLGASALIVGAPTYSDNAYKHDIGAVYIYIDQTNEGSKQMLFKRTIKGPSIGSYFGHAIENLGDIDGDDKDEIVIAAPFENGNGAVYIYSGASILDEKTPPIRIQPTDFQSFGFSLAIIEDTDGNGSKELAIGSPLDNKVVVFNTFASIKVILSAELYQKENNSDEHYVLKYCIETHLKQENITADLVIVIELRNAEFKTGRSRNGVYEFILPLPFQNHKNKNCTEHYLEVSDNKLLMSYNITVSLKEDPQKKTKFDPSRVLLSEIESVLNAHGENGKQDTSIEEPKLTLNIFSSITQPYMIGSSYLESFTLSVVNAGGPASKSCVKVFVEGARVVAYPRSCKYAADGLLCRHNQIIRSGSVWENDFKVDTNHLTSIHKNIAIRSDLYPQCGSEYKTSYEKAIELKPYNNMVEIKGQSNPDRIVNMTIEDLQKGKSLEHVYTIYNYGLTNWVGVKSEVILESSPYIDYSKTPIQVYPYTSSTKCEIETNSQDEKILVLCDIGNMKRQEKVIVVVSIAIVPGILEFESDDQNVTITSSLNLLLRDENKYLSLNTTLTFTTAEVPLWVTLASSFIGIFLMIILSYILYEYGFLRRKTKDKLIEKKQEVYRASMRRSMICANMREQMSRERDRQTDLHKQDDDDEDML